MPSHLDAEDSEATIHHVGARLIELEHVLPPSRPALHRVALLLGQAIGIARRMKQAQALLGADVANSCAIGPLDALRLVGRAAELAAETLHALPRDNVSLDSRRELESLVARLRTISSHRDVDDGTRNDHPIERAAPRRVG